MKRTSTRVTPTRRQVLAAGAAVAGGGMVGACASPREGQGPPAALPTFGASAPLAADQPIRIGVIGTGGMGTNHCIAILGLVQQGRAAVEIAALADVCQTHLDAAHALCSDGQPGVEVAGYRHLPRAARARRPARRLDRLAGALARPDGHRRPGGGQGRLRREADDAAAPRGARARPRGGGLREHRAGRHAVRADPQVPGRAQADRGGRDRQARLVADELLPQLEGRRVDLLRDRPGGAARRGTRLGGLVRTARAAAVRHARLPPLAPLPRLLDRHRRRPPGARDDADDARPRPGLAGPRRRHRRALRRQGHGEPRPGQPAGPVRERAHAGRRRLDRQRLRLRGADPRPPGVALPGRQQLPPDPRGHLRRRDRAAGPEVRGRPGARRAPARLVPLHPHPRAAARRRRDGAQDHGHRRPGHALDVGGRGLHVRPRDALGSRAPSRRAGADRVPAHGWSLIREQVRREQSPRPFLEHLR